MLILISPRPFNVDIDIPIKRSLHFRRRWCILFYYVQACISLKGPFLTPLQMVIYKSASFPVLLFFTPFHTSDMYQWYVRNHDPDQMDPNHITRRYEMMCMSCCRVQIQPMNQALDHAEYTAPWASRTNEKYICPALEGLHYEVGKSMIRSTCEVFLQITAPKTWQIPGT